METIYKLRDWMYLFLLRRYLRGSETVLDLGCGSSSPLQHLHDLHLDTTGMDLYQPSLNESKKKLIHSRYVKGDLLTAESIFYKKHFDTVIILDVIEHFKKKDALQLLKIAEHLATRNVIIMTPNGFYDQDDYQGNPHQIHLSGWSADDLRKSGYEVRGIRGLKYLRGKYASIHWKPWFLWASIAFISEPLLYFFPELSYDLLAVKKIRKSG